MACIADFVLMLSRRQNQQASSLAEEEPVQSSSTSKSTPSTAPSVHHQPEWAPRKITLRDSFYKKEAERTRDERSVQRRAGEMRDATRRRKSMPHFGSPSMERGVDPVDRRALEQDMTPLRLTPSLGRTVFVNQNGGGLQFAFNRLGAKVAADQLRTKARLQRFHERPGLKKKRLVQERKELRFMRGYVKMKDRVRLLVRKGW
ncbi:MAG: hypothetical protein M1814_000372 [Vezdaea aestivalis]|nr:MAG: hypothetical protein M1814_000372 [Vezdaea aestivalis]